MGIIPKRSILSYFFFVLWNLLLFSYKFTIGSNSSIPLTFDPKATYMAILPCIENCPFMQGKQTNSWRYPDDAEAHYKDLLLKTEKYRNVPMHEAAGYHGPWIENQFIDKFMSKPLSYFNGLIPLFIQWVDIHVLEIDWDSRIPWNDSIPAYKNYHLEISKWLRPEVIYVAVSQDDQGIHKLTQICPNILVLSAGGYGHIPIPLLKDTMEYIPPKYTNIKDINVPSFEWEFGFYGNLRPRLSRSRMLSEIRSIFETASIKFKFAQSSDWRENIANTKFNLVPRGFGRTSYRLTEVVHIGRIPVYLYDDIPWIPYVGTNISIEQFGFTGRMGNLNILVKQAVAVGKDGGEIARRLEYVRNVREHYTYEGVLRQMELFFRDPLGPRGGYLRCVRVPDTDKRRS